MLGGIAGATERLVVGTGVTWPIIRAHPVIVAHAAATEGQLFTEIALPQHFAAAFKPITEAQVAEAAICGPDPARHLEAIRAAHGAGHDHVRVHQVGPEQTGFIRFYEAEVLPRLRRVPARDPRLVGRHAA